MREKEIATSHGTICCSISEKFDSKRPTIFFLNGFSLLSTYLTFQELIAKIENAANVVAIDFLGYGFSQITQSKRTIENISKELGEAIESFDFSDGYIFAYSSGGIYAMHYLCNNDHKIKGLFGMEPTVYSPVIEIELNERAKQFRTSANWVNTFDEQRKIQAIKLLSKRFDFKLSNEWPKNLITKMFNKNQVDESDRMAENISSIQHFHIPDVVEVTLFVRFELESKYLQSNYMNDNNNSKIRSYSGKHNLLIDNLDLIYNDVIKVIEKHS
jgi:pimeloyl-ACP methyl ester carboxylesterase